MNTSGRTGGTLIEVLVSLVILTLVGSSLVEVMAQRRRALQEALRTQAGTTLAIRWRTARLQQLDWSKGDSGSFPDTSDDNSGRALWSLEPFATESSGSPIAPDAHWRQLVIQPSADSESVSFVFWLDDSPVVSSPQSGSAR